MAAPKIPGNAGKLAKTVPNVFLFRDLGCFQLVPEFVDKFSDSVETTEVLQLHGAGIREIEVPVSPPNVPGNT